MKLPNFGFQLIAESPEVPDRLFEFRDLIVHVFLMIDILKYLDSQVDQGPIGLPHGVSPALSNQFVAPN